MAEDSTQKFALMAENERKSAALVETKERYDHLVEENKLLLEEREATQQETYEVTEFLRQEIARKNERNKELEAHIEEHEGRLLLVRQECQAEAQRQLETAVREFEGTMHGLRAELEVSQAEVTKAKLKLSARSATLEAEEVRKDDRAKVEELVALERRFIEQQMQLRREYEQRVEGLKKKFEEDLDERMDSSVKRILQTNQRMKDELQLHMEETASLQRENGALARENKRLAREVELRAQREAEFAKKGTKQARDVKETTAKVRSLEKSLGQVITDFELERQKWEARRLEEAKQAKGEADGLKRLVALKTKELKNIRKLAQDVIRQRGDVEHFLITSIEFVKAQVALERFDTKENGPLERKAAPVRGPDSSLTRSQDSGSFSSRRKSGSKESRPMQAHESKLPNIRQSVALGETYPIASKQAELSDEAALTGRSSEGSEKLMQVVDELGLASTSKENTPSSDTSKAPNVESDVGTASRSLDRRRKPKVDIAELSWADREKVLRLLFARINSAYQPSYFGAPPPPEQEESARWTRGPTSVIGRPDMV